LTATGTKQKPGGFVAEGKEKVSAKEKKVISANVNFPFFFFGNQPQMFMLQ
jgi:hypothetical protein